MYCPRLDHFVRLNYDGTIGRCGHMVRGPCFDSLTSMDNSTWLKEIKQQFAQDVFPKECVRCEQTEQINSTSIRLNAIEFDKKQTKSDYLTVGGVLDNVCNSACQTCNENLSTKIGSLTNRRYIRIDNASKFWELPLDRVVHLDINGGEPSASKNYKRILANIPANVASVRVNTNCSSVLDEVEALVQKGIHVTITVSLDGIGQVHDYVRWPIKFADLERNLKVYQNMGIDLNTWTTVSALNIGNLKNIFAYVNENKLNHSWALLESPNVLHVKHKNKLTLSADVPDELKDVVASAEDNSAELEQYVSAQDLIRNISIKDYMNL